MLCLCVTGRIELSGERALAHFIFVLSDRTFTCITCTTQALLSGHNHSRITVKSWSNDPDPGDVSSISTSLGLVRVSGTTGVILQLVIVQSETFFVDVSGMLKCSTDI